MNVDLLNSEDFINYYDGVGGAISMVEVIKELLKHDEVTTESEFPSIMDLKYNGYPVTGVTVMREKINVSYMED